VSRLFVMSEEDAEAMFRRIVREELGRRDDGETWLPPIEIERRGLVRVSAP
jgi:hypothetical protein